MAVLPTLDSHHNNLLEKAILFGSLLARSGVLASNGLNYNIMEQMKNDKMLEQESHQDTERELVGVELRQLALQAGKEAVQEAFSRNLPITIGKDGHIIKVYPNKTEEIIGRY